MSTAPHVCTSPVSIHKLVLGDLHLQIKSHIHRMHTVELSMQPPLGNGHPLKTIALSVNFFCQFCTSVYLTNLCNQATLYQSLGAKLVAPLEGSSCVFACGCVGMRACIYVCIYIYIYIILYKIHCNSHDTYSLFYTIVSLQK